MHTDPIADLLIRIKNAYISRKETVWLPHSKIKQEICRLMEKQGIVTGLEKVKNSQAKFELRLKLIYKNKLPALNNIVRISKPGRRVYVASTAIPKVLSGRGECIISTSQGIMTGKEARKNKIGGELICKYW